MIKETEILTDLQNLKIKVNVLALQNDSESWYKIEEKIDAIVSEIKEIMYGKE